MALEGLIDEQLEADAISADEHQRLERLQEGATRRASRQRHRLDTDDSQRSDSLVTQGAALEATTSTTIDEPSHDTCTTAKDSSESPTQNLSRQAAQLTRAEDSAAAPGASARAFNNDLKLSTDQNLSLEVDTESSNLGAALSMSEDISEREAISSVRQHGSSPDERASEVQRFVDQLVNEEDEEEAREQAEEELKRATDKLNAALELATAEDGRDQLAESLANAILDEEEQRTIELESDHIERWDPRGQRSLDRPNSPAIRTQDTQPALVSGGSFDDEQQQQPTQQDEGSHEQHQQRLGVESLDEAIGSGRSSPALVSSNATSSEGEDDENEEDGATKAAAGHASDKQEQSQQGAQSGNKNRKKNRNRKKGRK